MNTTQLILCQAISLILCALMLIKLHFDLRKLRKQYERTKRSYYASRIDYVEGQYAILYDKNCHLENLVEAQSEKLKQYQQLLMKD
jgi:hypothetical protein